MLEERHGDDLGAGYKNNQACSMFVEYNEGILCDKAKYFSPVNFHGCLVKVQSDRTLRQDKRKGLS